MARAKTLKGIESKYSKKIEKLLDKMQNATVGELWEELDKLKAQMQKEMDEIGIK